MVSPETQEAPETKEAQETKEASGRTIRTVKLWMKAFIPNDYEGAVPVPGSGVHTGKTMINMSWLVNRSFLTDQRSFSDDIHAEARMHSEIEIDIARNKETYQFHHCYDTVEIDAYSGDEKCRAQGDTDSMRFHDFKISTDRRHYTVKINAGSKNPCVKIGKVKLTPSLDFEGTITVFVEDDASKAVVTFNGKVEKYPAFEMYASANDGAPQTIFQIGVAPSASVGDLPGGPERTVYGRAELSG